MNRMWTSEQNSTDSFFCFHHESLMQPLGWNFPALIRYGKLPFNIFDDWFSMKACNCTVVRIYR
ncbi:hypothetical protein QTP86_026998 [Hemibagrus guttatus]|nr:hypothetical protein QTP86_026998 [Hemibagrus guttatus]